MRRRGGGHKRRYRQVDFRRDKDGVPGVVSTVEYDPNRSARVSLITYADGDKRYILTPMKTQVGHVVMAGEEAEIRPGEHHVPVRHPAGNRDPQHRVEARKGRAAGPERRRPGAAHGEGRELRPGASSLQGGSDGSPSPCRATIGQLGNLDHENVSLGKAGRSRWLGRRPKVRGVAMNPIDHPMGGGEGKSSGGRHPTTPWGKPTKGYKTRKKGKPSDRYIVRRRKS